jgi:acylphosphatase
MSGDEPARLHLIITGRVQGVFFRQAAAEQARNLGISGWARNLNDGSVEIVGEGKRRDLDILLAWAHRGPSHARVDRVEVEWGSCEGKFAQFQTH